MELEIGDLVRHKFHNYYGIVLSKVGYWHDTAVVKVEWCESGLNHLIDVYYLDKLNRK